MTKNLITTSRDPTAYPRCSGDQATIVAMRPGESVDRLLQGLCLHDDRQIVCERRPTLDCSHGEIGLAQIRCHEFADVFCCLEDFVVATADGHVATPVAGVATVADDTHLEAAIEHARLALEFATTLPAPRIATWSMVLFQRAATQSESESADPVVKLETLLASWEGEFGPTKVDHLVTHSRYVAAMAVRLGRALDCPQDAIERLRVAGLFHDLGKLILPEALLAKRSALTDSESRVVRRHAADGAVMARELGVDEETAAYIRHHHTRYDDGWGCASSARSAKLGAQILAVADAFVTMTSHRPYSCARSFEDALHELQGARGGQFCPDVIAALPGAFMEEA